MGRGTRSAGANATATVALRGAPAPALRASTASQAPAAAAASLPASASAPTARERLQALKDRHPNVSMSVYARDEPGRPISLDNIEAATRGQGDGGRAMQDLCRMADEEGRAIHLTPDHTWRPKVSRPRLIAFYKELGFVENKGRNKDLRISDTMYRLPVSP